MSDLLVWSVIVGVALLTFATRCSFLVFGDRFILPERVQRALRYAPACALAALLAPEVLAPTSAPSLSAPAAITFYSSALATLLGHSKILAAVATIATMLATRNMLHAMLSGTLVFIGLRWL